MKPKKTKEIKVRREYLVKIPSGIAHNHGLPRQRVVYCYSPEQALGFVTTLTEGEKPGLYEQIIVAAGGLGNCVILLGQKKGQLEKDIDNLHVSNETKRHAVSWQEALAEYNKHPENYESVGQLQPLCERGARRYTQEVLDKKFQELCLGN